MVIVVGRHPSSRCNWLCAQLDKFPHQVAASLRQHRRSSQSVLHLLNDCPGIRARHLRAPNELRIHGESSPSAIRGCRVDRRVTSEEVRARSGRAAQITAALCSSSARKAYQTADRLSAVFSSKRVAQSPPCGLTCIEADSASTASSARFITRWMNGLAGVANPFTREPCEALS